MSVLHLFALLFMTGIGAASANELEKIRLYVQEKANGVGARAEVNVGPVDPRLTLAPCNRIEPYLAPGTRLWGKSWVGVRCMDGANWNITVPIQVRVFGPALVARRSITAGNPVALEDVDFDEIELSRENGPVLTDAQQLEGKLLARSAFAGQPLRIDHFRSAPVITQGDAVKLVAIGPGFSISADGLALAHAGDGQTVRVKTDSGRIINGLARPGRIVEVRY